MASFSLVPISCEQLRVILTRLFFSNPVPSFETMQSQITWLLMKPADQGHKYLLSGLIVTKPVFEVSV